MLKLVLVTLTQALIRHYCDADTSVTVLGNSIAILQTSFSETTRSQVVYSFPFSNLLTFDDKEYSMNWFTSSISGEGKKLSQAGCSNRGLCLDTAGMLSVGYCGDLVAIKQVCVIHQEFVFYELVDGYIRATTVSGDNGSLTLGTSILGQSIHLSDSDSILSRDSYEYVSAFQVYLGAKQAMHTASSYDCEDIHFSDWGSVTVTDHCPPGMSSWLNDLCEDDSTSWRSPTIKQMPHALWEISFGNDFEPALIDMTSPSFILKSSKFKNRDCRKS